MDIPTLIPNTRNVVYIRYYIMPHSKCSAEVIIGEKDMKLLGYVIGLKFSF